MSASSPNTAELYARLEALRAARRAMATPPSRPPPPPPVTKSETAPKDSQPVSATPILPIAIDTSNLRSGQSPPSPQPRSSSSSVSTNSSTPRVSKEQVILHYFKAPDPLEIRRRIQQSRPQSATPQSAGNHTSSNLATSNPDTGTKSAAARGCPAPILSPKSDIPLLFQSIPPAAASHSNTNSGSAAASGSSSRNGSAVTAATVNTPTAHGRSSSVAPVPVFYDMSARPASVKKMRPQQKEQQQHDSSLDDRDASRESFDSPQSAPHSARGHAPQRPPRLESDDLDDSPDRTDRHQRSSARQQHERHPPSTEDDHHVHHQQPRGPVVARPTTVLGRAQERLRAAIRGWRLRQLLHRGRGETMLQELKDLNTMRSDIEAQVQAGTATKDDVVFGDRLTVQIVAKKAELFTYLNDDRSRIQFTVPVRQRRAPPVRRQAVVSSYRQVSPRDPTSGEESSSGVTSAPTAPTASRPARSSQPSSGASASGSATSSQPATKKAPLKRSSVATVPASQASSSSSVSTTSVESPRARPQRSNSDGAKKMIVPPLALDSAMKIQQQEVAEMDMKSNSKAVSSGATEKKRSGSAAYAIAKSSNVPAASQAQPDAKSRARSVSPNGQRSSAHPAKRGGERSLEQQRLERQQARFQQEQEAAQMQQQRELEEQERERQLRAQGEGWSADGFSPLHALFIVDPETRIPQLLPSAPILTSRFDRQLYVQLLREYEFERNTKAEHRVSPQKRGHCLEFAMRAEFADNE